MAYELSHQLSKELTRLRVLLADRHTAARESLRAMLSSLGITDVFSASTAADVLQRVGSGAVDVILTDFQLEDGRDGQQLLEELRHKRLIPLSTVYMIVTAERSFRTVVSIAELTPDDYVIKPFSADQFLTRLARAIDKKRAFASIFQQFENGAYEDALVSCEQLIKAKPALRNDVLKFKGELLNLLGRHEAADAVFEQALEAAAAPWAKIGRAASLRGQGRLEEAAALGSAVVNEHPEYLAAYDFVAAVQEDLGLPADAQVVLQKAVELSPNNSVRQQTVGDLAVRNGDLKTAERAYGKVLERRRGSSLTAIDDYTNLTRVMLEGGQGERARRITEDLRRDWRGNAHGELAALVMDSLCAQHEGEPDKAKQALEDALALQEKIRQAEPPTDVSHKVSVDLAHACLAAGHDETAHEILGKVAAENHGDKTLLSHIQGVFAKTGNEAAGQALLEKVDRKIVELNNRGVMAAQSGDLEGAVRMLIEAAEHVPSLQFLVNASKAIFTLIDQKGWDATLAERGLYYLEQAQSREVHDPKVVSARQLYCQVARKCGVEIVPIGASRPAPGESIDS